MITSSAGCIEDLEVSVLHQITARYSAEDY